MLVPGHTLTELIHVYEKDYAPHKAAQTQYQEHLFFRWIHQELGDIALADLSPLILRSWRDSLRPHYAPGSIRRFMTSLSAVLTVAVDKLNWLEKHPLRQVQKPPESPGRERSLSAAEQTALLRACQQSRNRGLYLLVILVLSTACRKNELVQRRWEDIDLTRDLLSIPRAKNGERRAIPLVAQASALLREHARLATSPWVFPQASGERPGFLDYAWRQACKRAAITDLHLHDLRHTAASYLAMSGATLAEISEILGHRSLEQTRAYVHLVEPHTRGVLERMSQQFLEGG